MTEPRAWSLGELPAIGEAALCMGAFDGVHLGHLALVAATVGIARKRGVGPVALVFEPHPDEVVRPGVRVPRLAPLDENLRRLREAGIEPVPLRFDDALRSLTAGEFLTGMAPAIQVRGLVMTPESAFGRDRAGTPQAMQELGHEAGFEVRVIERLLFDDEQPISSGRIRRALADGALERAAALLGHAPYLAGQVSSAGLMEFAYWPALPASGIYGARSRGATPSPVHVRIGPDGIVAMIETQPPGFVALDLLSRA
jgi:riboflavin kinase / FMN adenylyltransferase